VIDFAPFACAGLGSVVPLFSFRFVGHLLKRTFPQPVPAAAAATAANARELLVFEDVARPKRRGLAEILEREIITKNFYQAAARPICFPVALEAPDILFFLGVNGNDRYAFGLRLLAFWASRPAWDSAAASVFLSARKPPPDILSVSPSTRQLALQPFSSSPFSRFLRLLFVHNNAVVEPPLAWAQTNSSSVSGIPVCVSRAGLRPPPASTFRHNTASAAKFFHALRQRLSRHSRNAACQACPAMPY
jgi:hypothetical protein